MLKVQLYKQRNWMGEKLKKILIALLVLTLNLSLFPIETAHAANASLYITPASSSQAVGNKFTVYVGVNSGGNAINAIEGTANFPSGVVAVTGAGTGGSLCSIWVQSPTVSGSSVSFKCGIPGGTTGSGNLISVSLTASAVGSGSASISGARILAGPGENVTGGSSGGSFNITAKSSGASSNNKPAVASTAAATISSSTHGDQNAWYKNKNVALSWTRSAGVTGYSYSVDRNEGTVPATTANTNETSLNLTGKDDGIWYLHLRANSATGWSSTSNFRIQIDSTAPTNLDIVTEPKGESGKRPMVSFNAIDAASGIDHYEISMDQGEFQKFASPFTPSSIKPGEHTFTVRAYDKAGNVLEGKISVRIKEVPVPKITKPQSNTTFKLIQSLDIAGTADSTTKIDVYLDGVNIAKGINVSDDGSWSMTYKNILMPGKHKITAVAVRDGIDSNTSEAVTIETDPSAISIFGVMVPSLVVILILLAVIVLLVLLAIWLIVFVKRNKDKIRSTFSRNKVQTETEVSQKFSDMEEKLETEIKKTLKGKKSLTASDKKKLEEKLKADLKSTEQAIVETIEKDAKD